MCIRGWWILASVCACSPECGLITAASLQSSADHPGLICPPPPILQPYTPTVSCSKHPHLTSGHRCFPCCCCFPMTLLLKQTIQTWPPGSAGRRFRRTLYDLMKGISAAFWSLSDVCFREPPSSCWRQCSLKSLLLFVCWEHNAKANDVKLKAWMNDLEGQAETWWLPCCITLCCTEDVFSLCACLWICGRLPHFDLPTKYKQWWNERITLGQ